MDDIIVSIKSKGYQLNTSRYTLETITGTLHIFNHIKKKTIIIYGVSTANAQ